MKLQVKRLLKLATRLPLPIIRSAIVYHALKDGESILDVGCGKGSLGILMVKDSRFIVGIDLFLPYLKFTKQAKGYSDLLLADARYLPFRKQAFDIIVCKDVIEHVEKGECAPLIKTMEKIARRKVIIACPVGFSPQPALFIEENIWQTHRSLWFPCDFKAMGYAVRGTEGLYALRGEAGKIKFSGLLGIISLIASYLSQLIVYFIPRIASRMICVKNLSSESEG